MAEKILMPQLGESVTEGTISKWLVKVGDQVKKYDPICEVTTDKVNAEVPSTHTGTISEIVVSDGETVAVGTLICYIALEGEAVGAPAAAVETPAAPAQPAVEPKVPQGQPKQAITETYNPTPETDGPKQRFSPAVLKMAQEHNLNLSLIKGTGAGGRVTRKDVLAIVAAGGQQAVDAAQETKQAVVTAAVEATIAPTAVPAPAAQPTSTRIEMPADQGDQVVPLTAIRKTIASKMLQSKHDAPHAWTVVECDVSNLVGLRNRLKGEFKAREGFNLTFLPFFIKAVVESLKEYPIINSQWAGDRIIIKKAINISIAVATEDALFVPVIKDADQKSIFGLAKSIDDLSRKARSGRLSLDEMTGGTFTCNNTGSFGSVMSAPIINPPQAAILSMEAIVKRPVVKDNMIAIRDMVNLCLSLDHRVLDGLVCGRFLQSVKEKLESYDQNTRIY
jgi:2-oxoisovalerate dehydrogenase E2 component (dihydrolipoyl transacylase)